MCSGLAFQRSVCDSAKVFLTGRGLVSGVVIGLLSVSSTRSFAQQPTAAPGQPSTSVVGSPSAQGAPIPPGANVIQPPPTPPGYPAQAGYPVPALVPVPPPYAYPPPAYPSPYPYQQSSPGVLDYHEGEAIPAGYHLVEKPRRDWMYGGLAFFGLTYGIAFYVASLGDAAAGRNGSASTDVLYIPVAGPILGIRSFNAEGAGTFWLLVWGTAQAAGLGASIYGATTPRRLLYRNDITRLNLRLSPFVVGERPSPGITLHGEL